MKTKHADAIRRKNHVPADERTSQKDKAARFIVNEVLDEGRWPMSMAEIAELSKEKLGEDGWSRQHISNVIEQYFEPAEEAFEQPDYEDAYREGYQNGHEDGMEDAIRLLRKVGLLPEDSDISAEDVK